MLKKKKGYFSISAVSQMFDVHQQTIRMYEREGLIAPRRSDGNTRLFSEEDVERLEQIIYYTNKLGVNLAGVEVILKMQRRIEKLQKDLYEQVEVAFQNSRRELEDDKQAHVIAIQDATQHLDSLKKNKKKTSKKLALRDPAYNPDDKISNLENIIKDV